MLSVAFHSAGNGGAADIDRDGYDDVVVGAPKSDNAVPGLKDTGSVAVYNSTNAATLVMKKYGAVAKAGLGNSVAVGDVDSDGRADIIVDASKDDKPGKKVVKETGSVSVLSGAGL